MVRSRDSFHSYHDEAPIRSHAKEVEEEEEEEEEEGDEEEEGERDEESSSSSWDVEGSRWNRVME